MKYFVTVNGKKYEVEVETDEVVVTAEDKKTEQVKEVEVKHNTTPQNLEGEAVTAPMPGKILDIRVSAGQSVKKGELLLILEAMKMENEIVAAKDCVITGVAVNKGDNVNTGDKLVIMQ